MNPVSSDLPDLSSRFHLLRARGYPVDVLPPESLVLESPSSPLLDSPPLRSLARPGMKVVIAFTDATRPSPDRLLVRLLLSELEQAGVRRRDITLLCAMGLHRPMRDEEFAMKLGEENMRETVTANHSASNVEDLVDLGEIDGIPVVTNRRCVEADLLLATGIVEPHQYAGFSGGAKTVVIGCGGEATIRETHGAAMLDRPGTRLGKIAGNPFQEFLRRAGRRIGLQYVLNAALNADGQMIAAACGRPDAVHDYLVAAASRSCVASVDRPVHIALAGIPPAKGTNLYQASRGATYVALADRTPLLPGGPIIIPAAIPEGAGEGKGEQRFFEALASAASPAELAERLRREGFPAGAQRAYILARVLADHPVIVAGAERPDAVRACHMEPAPDLPTALDRAEELARRAFSLSAPDKPVLLAVPNALAVIVSKEG